MSDGTTSTTDTVEIVVNPQGLLANWTFDHPRLLAKGFTIYQILYDGMELWH